jgi:hypothetical protein
MDPIVKCTCPWLLMMLCCVLWCTEAGSSGPTAGPGPDAGTAAAGQPAEGMAPTAATPIALTGVESPADATERAKTDTKGDKPQHNALADDAAHAWSWFARGQGAPRLAGGILSSTVMTRPILPGHLLQPGDKVRVVAWGGLTINTDVLVDDAGNLPIPEFGLVPRCCIPMSSRPRQ